MRIYSIVVSIVQLGLRSAQVRSVALSYVSIAVSA